MTDSKNKLSNFIKNPSLALWELSIPMMLGMSVQAIYILIDTAFIGKWVGSNALAGLGLIFPTMFIIMGITFGLGSGATTVIAQEIGKGKKQLADNAAEHIIILGIILSIIFIMIGIFFGDTLIKYQSEDLEVYNQASSYFYTMLYGIPFMVLSIFFRSILSGEGDTLLPMKVLGLGTLINLLLDPLLIYYFQIKGAAMATVASQAIVFIIFSYLMIFNNKTYISLNLKKFSYDFNIFNKILKLGLPASMSMVIMSIGLFFYNSILGMSEYSTNAIAAYSTAHRIEHLFFIPIISLATSMVTLIGMFYGAKKYNLIDYIFYYSLKSGILISIFFGLIFYFFSSTMFTLFTNDSQIITIGTEYFKIFSFAIPFVTIGMISSRCMQGLGKAYPMFIITCFRVIIISCSFTYYFIIYLNKPLYYAWIAIFLSCFLSSIISYIWFLLTRKNILKY